MGLEYSANISIGGLTLEVNPEQYDKQFKKMGGFVRTIGGTLIDQEVSKPKYVFSISGLTQTQIDDIQKYVAAEYNLALIDFVPISERTEASRTVHELLETVTINGETIVRYIPQYTVAITDYVETYSANSVTYKINAEEM